MQSETLEMPRKPKTFKLDERLITALEEAAIKSGENPGGFVERILWRYCQGLGVIDLTAEPSKDKRGGKRPGAGRKAQPPEATDQSIEATTDE
jgi:hypothetical protein